MEENNNRSDDREVVELRRKIAKILLCVGIGLLLIMFIALFFYSRYKAQPTPAKVESAQTVPQESAAATEPAIVQEEDLIDNEDWEALEGLGKVESENGIFYVRITIPASLVGEGVTQETIDQNAGETYTSGKLNEDGSVTYKMTKKQHKAMLDSIAESIGESLTELVNDPSYNITEITHNKDFTVFDVHLSTNEVGLGESFLVLGMYMYGGMYSVFSGRNVDNIAVNYYNPAGELISTGNSSAMGN